MKLSKDLEAVLADIEISSDSPTQYGKNVSVALLQRINQPQCKESNRFYLDQYGGINELANELRYFYIIIENVFNC